MRKNFSLGIIIIVIGIIWLISNLGLFSFSIFDVFFRSLGKLWPLILVGFGINLILKENRSIKFVAWLIILAVILLYGIFGLKSDGFYYQSSPDNESSENQMSSIALDSQLEEGILDLDFGAGEFQLASTGDNLMQYKSNISDLNYDYRVENSGKKAVINFNRKEDSFNHNVEDAFCNLDLDKDLPWKINLDLGAAKGLINLKDLSVKELSIHSGASDFELHLGDKNRELAEVTINSGASSLEIFVPEEAGLKVKLNSTLARNNISDLGLQKTGDYYITPGFEDKELQYLFIIEMGVGKLNFQFE